MHFLFINLLVCSSLSFLLSLLRLIHFRTDFHLSFAVTETSLEESDNSGGLEHTNNTTTNNTNNTTTTKPPPPDSIAITNNTTNTINTTTTASRNPSSPNPTTSCTEGHEAAPLIEPESPEMMKRF